MAISNATRLSDFGSGIGTAGAVLKVDNTNQRVGIGTTDPRGMLQVGTGITMNGTTGIITARQLLATFIGDSNTTFEGDGSQLTGVSGFSTALASTGPGQQIFKTDKILNIGAGTSYKVESDSASGYVAFSRFSDIHLGTGATFVVGSGTTMIMDVLNVFS